MNNILKLLCIIVGFVVGGILGVVGLFAVTALIAQGIEDQSSLGWVWILMFITGPAGAFLGSVLGFMLHNRFITKLK